MKHNFTLLVPPPPLGTQPAALDLAADLSTALSQQLGLKLESRKAPVDVFVIDHVERPSNN
jgi:uncharacterized protein (TIGR03435 family)